MKHILVFAVLSFSSFVFGTDIANFKSGLVCTDGENFGWISHEEQKIHITGQSKCTYNKKSMPCTWYGYQFDYENFPKDSKLDCKISSSEVVSFGNPKEELDSETVVASYEIELPELSGHFFNPQYSGLSNLRAELYSTYHHTECFYKGRRVFEFNREYVYPAKP